MQKFLPAIWRNRPYHVNSAASSRSGAGRPLAGAGIHFQKIVLLKKQKPFGSGRPLQSRSRDWRGHGAPAWLPHVSLSEKRQESRRSTGDAQGPASAPWGPWVMWMQWLSTPSSRAGLPSPGGQSSHVCPLPTGSLTGNSDRLNPEPVVSSLLTSL